jgi:oxaloacetate decarboxylase alpha subunit
MKEIHFVDTTVRDGQLSLWALGMRTGAMLAIAEQMDRCGFESMEFFGFAGYIKMVREHKENPWDWMGLGAKKFHRTRLRYHGGLATGFEKIPRAVRLLMIERVVAHGITLTRSSDPWNDYGAAAAEIAALKKLGMDVVINIIYSVSPRHTDQYYAERARQAAAIQPYRICFKDVGGLLTPDRARALIPLIQENIGNVPLEFHGHCNNGLGPFNYLEAMKLGIDTLHTAIPPLANGSSQPSIFNIAANAHALEFKPLVDLEAVKPVEQHFTYIAKREGHPIGAQRGVRSCAVSASSSRRNDLQLAPSVARHGHGKPAAGNFGRSRAGARGIRLSDYGDAAISVRREPGGGQRHHRRTLQRSHRSIDSICAWPLGQRSAGGDGSERQRQDSQSAPS